MPTVILSVLLNHSTSKKNISRESTNPSDGPIEELSGEDLVCFRVEKGVFKDIISMFQYYEMVSFVITYRVINKNSFING